MDQEKLNLYLEQHFDPNVEYFDDKAKKNQKVFFTLTIGTIVASASIPILNYQGHILVASIFSALIVIASGVLAVCKIHENWITYRSTWDHLQQHKRLLDTRCSPYDGDDYATKFVLNVEQIRSSESQCWVDRVANNKEGNIGS